MAKLLLEERNVSPISRLIDPAAASAAVRPVVPDMSPRERLIPPEPQPMTALVATVLIKRECVLTRPTDEALTRLTEMIRRTTGARINASHAVRCLLNALAPVWPRLEDELRGLGPLKLPSNARGHEREREDLEIALARALARAMRSSAADKP